MHVVSRRRIASTGEAQGSRGRSRDAGNVLPKQAERQGGAARLSTRGRAGCTRDAAGVESVRRRSSPGPPSVMTFAAGTRLGPYEITARIGSGGMGEVYRAHDTRLDRTVALKVLPPVLSRDEKSRQRFDREARLVAGLSHPHICTVFDVGHQDGVDFLVMEFLEGETLAERLTRGRLPLDVCLRYALEIAEALAAAHASGIVHRDLKPANVMLTPGGAKLLDFGLAKARVDGPVPGLTDVGTGEPLTGAGAAPGTLQYMSPEQLEGGDADARSDIFAFGAVLYEMATGRRAFEGRSRAAVIVKILESDPAPMLSLVDSLPEPLEFIVATCLAKEPAARWQSAQDVLIQLRRIESERADSRFSRPAAARARRVPSARWSHVAAGVVLGALLASLALLLWPAAETPPAVPARYDVALPPALGFDWPDWPIVSPDGRQVAFTARLQGTRQLWIRRADATVAPLPGTEGATFAFWSPDSRAVAFFAGRALKKVDAAGGSVTILADAYSVSRGAWSREGTIVFAPRHNGPLHAVPAEGGAARAVTTLDSARGDTSHQFPHVLPDGRHFLYAAAGRDPGVRVGSLDGSAPVDVLRTFTPAWYSASGFLVFGREQRLLAQRFDLATFATSGPTVSIAEPVSGGAFSLSETGTLAFRPGQLGGNQLVWFDRDGRRESTLGDPAYDQQVVLSPTARWAAVQRIDTATGNPYIWLVEVATRIASRVTVDPAMDGDPAWSPDERSFAFTSFRRGRGSVYLYDLVTGRERPLYDLPPEEPGDEPEPPTGPSLAPARIPEGVAVDDWTHDGEYLVVRSFGRAVYAVAMSGEPTARLLADTPYVEDESRVSPDGRSIAFNSDESGRWEVYVATFPGFTDKRQVSSAGGMQPRWRRDSKELYYLSLDGAVMAAAIETSPRPQSDVPRQLFQTRLSPSPSVPQYDVSADGSRFLVLESANPAGEPLTFLLNWADAARRSGESGR
jgi:eukaryotic-like serine/threonine-protein kinase